MTMQTLYWRRDYYKRSYYKNVSKIILTANGTLGGDYFCGCRVSGNKCFSGGMEGV